MELSKEKKFWQDLSKIGKLDESTKIKDINKFINTHIEYLEFNKGNKTFKPYYDRLLKLINTHMIGKFLKTGEKTFDDILVHTNKHHHKKSLEIELQTLINIGNVIYENGKYKLK